MGEEVTLPVSLELAIELWTAWRDKGTLPRAGGLLDQPRWWRTLMRFVTSRYTPVYAAWQAEQALRDSTSNHDDYGEAAVGFDALMSGE